MDPVIVPRATETLCLTRGRGYDPARLAIPR